jgi:transposase
MLWKEEIEELEQARKKNKNKNVERRLKALLLHGKGEEHQKIADQTEYSVTYISELVTKYIKKGITAIIGNNYRGNRRNMSIEEEKILLESFKKQAEEGRMVETSDIERAYEKAIGRSLEKSRGQIYRVLKRHGWRKVMPRSKHPNKASDEEIEASKKLTKL